MKMWVDLPFVNKVKAVKISQNVGCLLKKAMELGKCNSGAMEQSSLVCTGMHLEGDLAAEAAGGQCSAGISTS